MSRKIIEMDTGFFQLDPEDKDAQYIASVIPGFKFKGVPSFFDVGGITQDPKALRLTTEIFAERYKGMKIDKICGLDARGFIFGPLVAQALQVPFFMMRKEGKLPGPTMAVAYETEYSKEVLTIPCHAVKPGDRVVIFDDLIATGGTTIAAANLLVECGAVVAEVAVVTAIAFFKGWVKFRSSLPQLKDVPIFSIVEATKCRAMPVGSTDTFTVAAGSAEHQAIVHAMSTSAPGDVICRETSVKEGVVTTRITARPLEAGPNVEYLKEGVAEHE